MRFVKSSTCLETEIRQIFQHPINYTYVVITADYSIQLYDIVTMQVVGRSTIPIWSPTQPLPRLKMPSRPEQQMQLLRDKESKNEKKEQASLSHSRIKDDRKDEQQTPYSQVKQFNHERGNRKRAKKVKSKFEENVDQQFTLKEQKEKKIQKDIAGMKKKLRSKQKEEKEKETQLTHPIIEAFQNKEQLPQIQAWKEEYVLKGENVLADSELNYEKELRSQSSGAIKIQTSFHSLSDDFEGDKQMTSKSQKGSIRAEYRKIRQLNKQIQEREKVIRERGKPNYQQNHPLHDDSFILFPEFESSSGTGKKQSSGNNQDKKDQSKVVPPQLIIEQEKSSVNQKQSEQLLNQNNDKAMDEQSPKEYNQRQQKNEQVSLLERREAMILEEQVEESVVQYHEPELWSCVFSTNFNEFYMFGKGYIYYCELINGQIQYDRFSFPNPEAIIEELGQESYEQSSFPIMSAIGFIDKECFAGYIRNKLWMVAETEMHNILLEEEPATIPNQKKLIQRKRPDYVSKRGNMEARNNEESNSEFYVQNDSNNNFITKKTRSKSMKKEKLPHQGQLVREILTNKLGICAREISDSFETQENQDIIPYTMYHLPCQVLICRAIAMLNYKTLQREWYWLCLSKSKEVYLFKISTNGYEFVHSFSVEHMFERKSPSKVKLVINNSSNRVALTSEKIFFSVYNANKAYFYTMQIHDELSLNDIITYEASFKMADNGLDDGSAEDNQSNSSILSLCFFHLGINTSSINKFAQDLYVIAVIKQKEQNVQSNLQIGGQQIKNSKKPKSKIQQLQQQGSRILIYRLIHDQMVLQHILNLSEVPESDIWMNPYLDNHIMYLVSSVNSPSSQDEQKSPGINIKKVKQNSNQEPAMQKNISPEVQSPPQNKNKNSSSNLNPNLNPPEPSFPLSESGMKLELSPQEEKSKVDRKQSVMEPLIADEEQSSLLLRRLKIINILSSCSEQTRFKSRHDKKDVLSSKQIGKEWTNLGYKFEWIEKNELYHQRQDQFDEYAQKEQQERQLIKGYSKEQINALLNDWTGSYIDKDTYWDNKNRRLDCISFDFKNRPE